MLQQYQTDGSDRLLEICARVVSVCTVVIPTWGAGGQFQPARADQGVQVWEPFPLFTKLKMLELHGDIIDDSDYEVSLPEISETQLPDLQYVKLFGYIPRTFTNWVLRSASTLQRLELGMLDRPISSTHDPYKSFRPLPEDRLPSMMADDETCEGSDYGSLDGDTIIPRRLVDFCPQISSKMMNHKLNSICQD